MSQLLSINEASEVASTHLKKTVTPSNISYLITYGRIKKYGENGNTRVDKKELLSYYNFHKAKEEAWKEKLGEDLNWKLSFSEYKESETTKHVHRLHPYKGKFIPQLVQYFLDGETDNFKKEVFFKKGDIVLDPFCGSGTTLVQANELEINAIGIDVSEFNTMISNMKVDLVDLVTLKQTFDVITQQLKEFISNKSSLQFEEELLEELRKFNNVHFPVPDYKFRVREKEFIEKEYSEAREKEFLPVYYGLVEKYKIPIDTKEKGTFIERWFLHVVVDEINFLKEKINAIQDDSIRKVAMVVLSRTVRSCRATTHSDLATLLEPIRTTYYCTKHYKICKPIFNILSWWVRYSEDTIKRYAEFYKRRKNSFQVCLLGDSRSLDLAKELELNNKGLFKLFQKKKIKGIFSSPPYVGVIDYHEQHAYAYDIFGFNRNDKSEIGPLYKGQGKAAQESYIEGISAVLNNCKKYLKKGYNIFLVANDKYNLYPKIAERSGLIIVNQFKRPVLNRTEKDKNLYSEIIFHLREQAKK
jgi:DNA modification methylase